MDDRERWNSRYSNQTDRRFEPPSALVRLSAHLPKHGTAIDLAGGTGGGALHYAAAGLQAVLVDVSDEALSQASEHVAGQTVSTDLALRTVRMDLEGRTLGDALDEVAARHPDLPPVTVVSCFHYLQRTLLASVSAALPPGAVFLAAIATKTNLERNERPSSRFLLEPGELEPLVLGSDGLVVRHSTEGWNDGDHHEAELVVMAPERSGEVG